MNKTNFIAITPTRWILTIAERLPGTSFNGVCFTAKWFRWQNFADNVESTTN